MTVLASLIKTEQSRQQDQMQYGPHRSRDSPGPSVKRQSRPISQKGPRPTHQESLWASPSKEYSRFYPLRAIPGPTHQWTLLVPSIKLQSRSHPSVDTPGPTHQWTPQVPPISGHPRSYQISGHPGSYPSVDTPGPTRQWTLRVPSTKKHSGPTRQWTLLDLPTKRYPRPHTPADTPGKSINGLSGSYPLRDTPGPIDQRTLQYLLDQRTLQCPIDQRILQTPLIKEHFRPHRSNNAPDPIDQRTLQ